MSWDDFNARKIRRQQLQRDRQLLEAVRDRSDRDDDARRRALDVIRDRDQYKAALDAKHQQRQAELQRQWQALES